MQLYNAIINRTNLHKSQYDIVEEIMDELQVKNGQRTKLHDVVKTMCRDEVDREKLYEIIQLNLQFLQG